MGVRRARASWILLSLSGLAFSPLQGTAQDTLWVDVGGHRLHAMVAGSGTPTLVLEHGLGDDVRSWDSVAPHLASFTSVIRYSRAGYGESEAGPEPRTPERAVAELRALLDEIGGEGPFILVGHSLGALYARLFTVTYPDAVVGLVLVDGSRERQFKVLWELEPEWQPSWEDVREVSSNAYSEAIEIGQVFERGEPVASGLPDIPMAILTSTALGEFDWPGSTPEGARRLRSLDTDLFSRTSTGVHVVTERSGHYIHQDEPMLVVSAIRHVVDLVRTRGRDDSG